MVEVVCDNIIFSETTLSNSSLALNEQVPDFSAAITGNTTFSLSDQHGKILVLYFYPKDNTPGCTAQSIGFRDLYDSFRKANAEIVGISRDSLRSHDGFKKKFALPFELISDSDEAVCALFDVIKNKKRYGKMVRGIERSTFLIDPAGKLVKEWRGLSVPGHVEEVLEAVRALNRNK